MKSSMLLAAGALLGSAQAGVHKMKLKKVPLAEQLVRLPSPILSPSWSLLCVGARQHRRARQGT